MRARRSLWDEIKIILNEYISEYITRSHLFDRLELVGFRRSSTIDTYRNYLTKAGFLQTSGRGRYLILNEIPVNLSVDDVKRMAYFKTPTRKLKWSEKPVFIKEDEFNV